MSLYIAGLILKVPTVLFLVPGKRTPFFPRRVEMFFFSFLKKDDHADIYFFLMLL